MILYTYYDSINIITIIVEKTLTHLLKNNEKNKNMVPNRERSVFSAL